MPITATLGEQNILRFEDILSRKFQASMDSKVSPCLKALFSHPLIPQQFDPSYAQRTSTSLFQSEFPVCLG